WIGVLPKSEHFPPCGPQLDVRVAVAAPICLDLRTPPICIGLWPGSVLGTAMPKAPIDENGNFRPREGHVCPAAWAWKRYVDPVTQAKSTQRGAQADLAGRIAPSSRLHSAANICRRRLRSRRLLRVLLRRCLLRRRAAPRRPLPT